MTNLIKFWGLGHWVKPDGSLRPDVHFSPCGFGGMAVFSEACYYKDLCFLDLGSMNF